MEETDKKITRRRRPKKPKQKHNIRNIKTEEFQEEIKYFANDKTLKCSVCLKADLISNFDRCPLCDRKINHKRKMVIG